MGQEIFHIPIVHFVFLPQMMHCILQHWQQLVFLQYSVSVGVILEESGINCAPDLLLW